MGVSFSFVPVAQQVITTLSQCACDGEPCTFEGTCVACTSPLVGKCHTPEEAYGKVLGTVSTSYLISYPWSLQPISVTMSDLPSSILTAKWLMPEFLHNPGLQLLVCCFFQMAISFVSSRVLRRVFPPVVTGTCLVLLGAALIGSGFQNWGGGVYCSSQVNVVFSYSVERWGSSCNRMENMNMHLILLGCWDEAFCIVFVRRCWPPGYLALEMEKWCCLLDIAPTWDLGWLFSSQ